MATSSGNTSATWQAICPVFTELYIDKDLTLKEAMSIMSEEYNFHASESMYKKWIKHWNIGKTMNAAEKDALIRLASLGQILPDKDSRNRPIRNDKLRRYLRDLQKQSRQRKRTAQIPGQANSTNVFGEAAESRPSQALIPIISNPILSDESKQVEIVLGSIRSFLSSLSPAATENRVMRRALPLSVGKASFQPQSSANTDETDLSFMDDYSKTCYLMRLNMKNAAFHSLSAGAAKISLALQNPQAGLLMSLLALITWRQWEIYSEHRTLLFNFLALTAKTTYNEDHPLARITCLYSQIAELQKYQSIILDCAVKELESDTSNTTTEEMTNIKYILIDCLIDRNDFQSAEWLCRLLIKETTAHYGEDSYETSYAKLCLGRLLYHAGKLEQALEILEQIWRPYNPKQSKTRMETIRTAASGWMGYVHEDMGSLYCAESRWWDFFLSHLRWGGADHPYTLYSLGMLLRFLRQTDRKPEIAWIRMQYSESYNILIKEQEAEIYQGRKQDARIPHLHINQSC